MRFYGNWPSLLFLYVLAAVSPAVVVPKMLYLMENKYGTNKSIPQLIMAGASVDDVFVIVIFTALTALARGEALSARSFVQIPVSIVTGLIVGILLGILLSLFPNIHGIAFSNARCLSKFTPNKSKQERTTP